MSLVIFCWVLAMISGLSWSRFWSGVLIALTALVFVGTKTTTLAHWNGWIQLAALTISPWLLAMARIRHENLVKKLHDSEARGMALISESARSLLSLQGSTHQIEKEITEITDVYHVTKETIRSMHLNELFEALIGISPKLLETRSLRLVDISEEPPKVLRAVCTDKGSMVLSAHVDGGSGGGIDKLLDMEQSVIKHIVSQGRSSSANAQELGCEFPQGVSRVSWAPLWQEHRPIGVLLADELPQQQLKTLSIVANQLSLQLSRIHLYQKVEALAVTDSLTGLFVRRYFLERAKEELVRSSRHNLPCALLMVDLDLFKQKNDTFGHLVGDVVLRDIAQLLKRNLREVDLIARFGGEEFILLLIETDAEHAMPIAQRLGQLVSLHPIRAYDELLTQTISIGVAVFPKHANTLEALIERADGALYAAKKAGRNRTIVWSDALKAQN